MKSVLIRENDFQKARKKKKESKEKRIFSSNNDELNRKILEKEKIDVLLLNQSQRRDRMKQRDSGLNHVLAKIAKKKGVAIGINLDEIINTRGQKKAEILARVKQNIKLCNKKKLRMKFITQKQRNIYDLKALGLVLGMPTSILKNL